ncbi:hypothetical protein KR018_001976 [Drosophila ironensis]|nr:hypothetical protein KR018_001976 [Drosophila ironensis]
MHQFLEDPHLRPPSPMQFWQRSPPQFERIQPQQGFHIAHIPAQFSPSAPATEPLYRLVYHWRNKPPQQQSQNIQNQGYPESSVNIEHSLVGDILVNLNTNNQFNPQAELVAPPPLSYQAQSGQPLWSEQSDWSDRSERDRDRDRGRERSVRQSREQQP